MPLSKSLIKFFSSSIATLAILSVFASGSISAEARKAVTKPKTVISKSLKKSKTPAKVAKTVPELQNKAATEPKDLENTTQTTPKFIEYQGNGGGLSLCKDGMTSKSTGRGTCSGHGGLAR